MASKVGDRMLQIRKFAQAAHKQVDQASLLKSEPLKQTKLPNGILVASIENYSPVSRVGVFFRAGSRFETSENLGITHVLRNSLGLSTKQSTIFGITRNIDYNGGSLKAISTRDNFIYLLENIRDKNPEIMHYLAESVSEPAFKSWELEDNVYRIKVDLERYQIDACAQLADLLHRAAFRGGLSNSLYCLSQNVGAFKKDALMDYHNKHFIANKAVVVGLGVDHDKLTKFVNKQINLKSGNEVSEIKSKYIGGDCRLPSNSKLTFASVVAEGAPLKNKKDALILEIFSKYLGTGARVSYGFGGSKVAQAVSAVAKKPFQFSSLNLNYYDTGLFGFTTITDGEETSTIIKTIVNTIRSSAKTFNDNELKIAK
ncbi:hypothetical protein RND71_043758 [Anisodus tanguticus]|uniref:Uncharacterized protein n=1 Tax=Anisodus tanguticus TaxID=243964 RepID=A0AAE1QRR5_9SOLA|nr:hypothetical protein RND71_043758 [Anisodus tanguticus]